MNILGIDIGGTGIKGAPVDVTRGALLSERYRIPTPQPATPDAVADVVAQIVHHFQWSGPIGCAFPAAVKHGVTLTAANVDASWIGTNAAELFQAKTGSPVTMINDADAAGLAEMQFGAGKGENGVVLLLTLGTGIGSALFVDGLLVPNTELGHMEIDGKEAEHRAADSVRQEKELTWKKWARRLTKVLTSYESLLFPDLFILGGGVSKKADKFLPLLEVKTKVVPAALLNDAGIIGAAFAAASAAKTSPEAAPEPAVPTDTP